MAERDATLRHISRANKSAEAKLHALRCIYVGPECAGPQLYWFGATAQWKRLPGNRLQAVAPVYSTLLEVPDQRICAEAAGARSTAVEFGMVLRSPLSTVSSAGADWWKLQLPVQFQPALMGVALYKLRHWHRPDRLPLFAAVLAGRASEVTTLVAAATPPGPGAGAGGDPRDFRGFTAVLLACEQGSPEVAHTVLRGSFRPTLAECADDSGGAGDTSGVGGGGGGGGGDGSGASAIVEACPAASKAMVAVVPATACHISLAGESALLVAAQHGHLQLVEWLLADHGGQGSAAHMLNLPAFAEVPPAAVTASAAALDRSEGVAVGVRARNEWRAQRGWSSEPGRQEQHAHRKASASSVLSWEKRGGQTPLHRAAACGHTAVVKALLAAGADSAVRDAAGFTIVHTIAAAAATAAERGEWAELGRAAVDIARKLLAVSEGGRWQEKAGKGLVTRDGRTAAQLLESLPASAVASAGASLRDLANLLGATLATQRTQRSQQSDVVSLEDSAGDSSHPPAAGSDSQLPPQHRISWPEPQPRVDSAPPRRFAARRARRESDVLAPVVQLLEDVGPTADGPQPGDQSDSLGVGKGSAVTKERRLSTGLLPGGESHQDAIEAVRLKLAELAAPTAVPGEEDWLGIGEELPVTSEAAAANERRRRETERYRMASDELFLAQTPEEIARAAMAGRGGDESLGELAQFGYLGGGKINTQLINEAETNKLINAGKLTATETAAAVEVGTVSGRPGKQKITFRNVQPSTFTGRGFHTTPGVVALEISECAKLADLPGVIALMPNLRTLEVMKNRLEELPAGVGKLSKLELLDCSHNKLLQDIPVAIGNLLELQTLRVAGNKLTALPASLEACQWLVELDLTANMLSELPSVVSDLAGLRTLKLGGNLLRELPHSLGQHYDAASDDGLDVLDISRNRFQKLPAELFARGLPREELNATDNKIDAVCSEILGLSTLTTLRLSRNLLSANLGLGAEAAASIKTQLACLQRVALSGNLLGPSDPVVEAMRAVCDANGGLLRL